MTFSKTFQIWTFLTGLSLVYGNTISLSPNITQKGVFTNETFFVSCKAANSNRMIWKKAAGEEIGSDKSEKVHVEATEDYKLDLVFNGVKMRDRGNYTCQATFNDKTLETTFSLLVFKPISFGDTQAVQYAAEGKGFTIQCGAMGDPKPSISWKFQGKSVKHSKKYEKQTNGLHIKNVTREDGGTYTCLATQSNVLTTDFKEKKIELKIQHKPLWFKEHSEGAYAFVGGSVNLTCSALAEPGAEFVWIKNNKTLQPGEYVQIYNSDHHSSLELYVSDDSVFGDYECKATNTLGTLARIVVLQRANKPSPPTFKIKIPRPDSMVLEIDESDVQADRGQDGREVALDVIGYRVQYKLPAQNWNEALEMDFERTPGKPYVVMGMQRDTPYELRVAARTAAGVGEYSSVKTERTEKWIATVAPIIGTRSGSPVVIPQCILAFIITALLSANLCI